MVNEKLILSATSPFRLDLTVWALRRRIKNIIDRWDGSQYTRIIVFNNSPVKINVTQKETGNGSKVLVDLQSKDKVTTPEREEAEWLIRKMFGLSIDLHPFYLLANNDVILQPLI